VAADGATTRETAGASPAEGRAVAERALDMSYLEGTIGYTIRRAQLAVFQDIFRAFGDLSVTPVQFSVLAVVADNPGASQSDLAAALGVERPRMVPIIDALERRDLAIRVPSTVDRRQRQIHLTDRGGRLLSDLKIRFSDHQQRMVDQLAPSDAGRFLRDLWRLAGGR
jgi:DNA-binding MarR family transcriptional regulator